MSLSMELVTFLGSTVLGGVMKLWGMSIQSKKEQALATLSMIKVKAKGFNDARKDKDPYMAVTRRAMVLMSVAAIIVLPLVAPLFTDVSVTHGWMEFKPGWLWVEGKEVMTWHTVKGIVITPMHTQLMAAIAGLYLGANTVK